MERYERAAPIFVTFRATTNRLHQHRERKILNWMHCLCGIHQDSESDLFPVLSKFFPFLSSFRRWFLYFFYLLLVIIFHRPADHKKHRDRPFVCALVEDEAMCWSVKNNNLEKYPINIIAAHFSLSFHSYWNPAGVGVVMTF